MMFGVNMRLDSPGTKPKRDEWRHCVKRNQANLDNQSWCGRDIQLEFCYLDLDHAFLTLAEESWHQLCLDCAKILRDLLKGNSSDGNE
jgi:hypothetical protein